MDKQYFIELLQKYLEGDLSTEERRFVESYYELFRNGPDPLHEMNAAQKEALKNDLRKTVWSNVQKQEMPAPGIKTVGGRRVRWLAAAVFTGVLLTGSFYFLNKKPVKQVIPDTGVAVKPSENRIIFLPDGSTAVLSPGSRLNYPSSFEGLDKREVFLEGEAFFDIRHNVLKQFIVHTGKLKTIVLGTSFNIRAIPEEQEITVTVKNGKVKVSDQQNNTLGIITPNEQITWNRKNLHTELTRISSESYLNWRNRDLFVDNATLSEAAKLLEERYQVRVIVADSSISSQRFTATFPRDENFEQAIKSICVFNGLSYQFDKQKSVVMITNLH